MATPNKAPTIRPPTSHHENYPSLTNQTCRTRLEKLGQAHKWCTPMDPTHMAEQKQHDQLEHTYSSYVRIRDVALKTCQRWWTIGRSGERESGISVLVARHNDDDDDDVTLRVRNGTSEHCKNICCVEGEGAVDHRPVTRLWWHECLNRYWRKQQIQLIQIAKAKMGNI